MNGMSNSDFKRGIQSEKKSGKGGSRGGFFDEYIVPKETYTPVLLIKNQFPDPDPQDEAERNLVDPRTGQLIPVIRPFFKTRQHIRAINGGRKPSGKTMFAWCRAGWDKHNQKPCAGHMAEADGLKDIKTKNAFLMQLIHLAVYHWAPAVNYQTGQLMDSDKKPGEKVMELVECKGRDCNYCRVKAGHPPVLEQGKSWIIPPQLITETFGARRFLNLGINHLGDLGGIGDTISHRCHVDGMVMETDGWACPWCDSMIIDLANDQRPMKELQSIVQRPLMCNTCRTNVLVEEVPTCRMCEPAGRVAEFKFNIFNQVLFLQREGEGTASKLNLKQFMSMDQFAQQINPALLNGRSLQEHLEILSRPYDFNKTLRLDGLTPEEEEKALAGQAKRLEVESILQKYRPGASYSQSSYGVPQGAPAAHQPGGYGLPPAAQPWAAGGAPGAPPFAPPQQFSAYPQGAQQAPGPLQFAPPPKPNYSNGQ